MVRKDKPRILKKNRLHELFHFVTRMVNIYVFVIFMKIFKHITSTLYIVLYRNNLDYIVILLLLLDNATTLILVLILRVLYEICRIKP